MKYLFSVFLLFAASFVLAQTPALHGTWSPMLAGSSIHITITEHQIIASFPETGLASSLPELISLPPIQSSPEPSMHITPKADMAEKSDTLPLLKVIYDSAKAKGRLFIQASGTDKSIIPLRFTIKDNGEMEIGLAADISTLISNDMKSLKQVEKATRKTAKHSSYKGGGPCGPDLNFLSGFTVTFYDEARTAQFAQMKNPALMPKEEMLGMINSFGNRMSAALQSVPVDTSNGLLPGFSYISQLYKNIGSITRDLFIAHGYNPLAAVELFEKLKDDSDVAVAMKAMGDKIEESVPFLRADKERREKYRNEYKVDSTMTATQVTATDSVTTGSAENDQPAGEVMHKTQTPSQVWYESLDEGLSEAKRSGKNVFIDFTGYTATNCRQMESTIFQKSEVTGLFEHYVLVKLYTDDGTPANNANSALEKKRFKTAMEPYYVILSPENKTLSTFPGFTRDDAAFVNFLKPYSEAVLPEQKH